ncbi:cyclase family protein [Aeromicrobium sp. IC_218]|uniref:cyclase family protein n=1 Tax=Aeromicrobium sp. IC_218 TaxID=2545468 RepID=UPI001A954CA6|nr:cyclase family protein [Aeromicrobium sp. IC_218]
MTRTGMTSPEPSGFVFMDDLVVMPLQTATQLDALAHVAYDGLLYNGVSVETVTADGASHGGIETMAAGIHSRGVLLDIARWRGVDRLAEDDRITAQDLSAAAADQGVDIGPGDCVLVRTGWMQVFTQDHDGAHYLSVEPGLDLTAARWLADRDIALVGSDNWGIEIAPWPDSDDIHPVHCVLIRDVGMPLAEMLDLDDLAIQCAARGQWDFLFSCQPLPVTGAVGSPIAPVAIL